jgi:dolichol-phosphate mannosyltransferase
MLSIVIPVYNENPSLAELHAEISGAVLRDHPDTEILFIDDGSSDGSWVTISDLARRDARVRGIRFRRNFGKAAALSAGFRAARGDLVMTLDADLQDDPKEIHRFLEQIKGGLDVVSGWKKVRLDPWHKVWPSRLFNWVVGVVTGVKLHDINCGMKCYRAEVLREVRLYGEMHRFIPVLAAARGFKVGEIAINHRPRLYGRSKYGARRFVKGFLDLMTVKFLTSFSHRPQHFLGSLGLLFTALGALGLTWLAFTWLVRLYDPQRFEPLHARALPIYALASLLLGVQLLSMGFLAELLTAFRGRDEDNYSISDRTETLGD